jgi:hypothetical protein
MRSIFCAIIIGALCLLAGGCSTLRTTYTTSTATERFLLTQAVSQAVDQLSAAGLRDKEVWVDATYLTGEEQGFIMAELRARLLTSGVRLMPKRELAKVVLEVRTGGIGVDSYEYFVGIPHVGVIDTPEFAIIKDLKQRGFASVAFVAYFSDTGELLAASGPFVGRTIRTDYWLFGSGPRTAGNIPTAEKLK